MSSPTFVSGLHLARDLHQDWVAPALQKHWPNLLYSAALMGDGSEVLGLDTSRSRDHDWGPRLYLFLEPAHFQLAEAIAEHLNQTLPESMSGFPVAFIDGDRQTGFSLEQQTCGSAAHGVEIFTLASFFQSYLGIDIHQTLSPLDWLVLPEARLLSATAGVVFRDDLGLQAIRDRLTYYPHDVWMKIMAAQWIRIAQEEAFVGRCTEVDDPLGAQLVLSRLVRDLMRLCFMQEQRYIPYSKWLGSCFARLKCAAELQPLFLSVLQAPDYPAQEHLLCAIYRRVAQQHNDLQLTTVLPTEPSLFHDRPYRVIHGERFAEALSAQITDPALEGLKYEIGSINQFVDSTDVLTHPHFCQRFHVLLD